MAGISRISQARKQGASTSNAGSSEFANTELWLKDGDDAFVSILATGEDDSDHFLDDFFIHTENTTTDSGGRGWVSFFCEKRSDSTKSCSRCDAGNRAAHRFGFWSYVYYTLHKDQREDDWEAVTQPSGETKYKEVIQDFRLFSTGFGNRDERWQQLVDIYNDDGSLNKNVVRLRRTGAGLEDTSYRFAARNNASQIPEDKQKESGELLSIKGFFRARYPGDTSNSSVEEKPAAPPISNNGTSDKSEELFDLSDNKAEQVDVDEDLF